MADRRHMRTAILEAKVARLEYENRMLTGLLGKLAVALGAEEAPVAPAAPDRGDWAGAGTVIYRKGDQVDCQDVQEDNYQEDEYYEDGEDEYYDGYEDEEYDNEEDGEEEEEGDAYAEEAGVEEEEDEQFQDDVIIQSYRNVLQGTREALDEESSEQGGGGEEEGEWQRQLGNILEEKRRKKKPVRSEEVDVDFAKQQEAMQTWYGSAAEDIYAMEAAVQLKFDDFCHREKPVHWPCMPLNLKFD